ncbi:MAG TPA: HAD family hydrolase [Streptosporangiaceae bacterium]|nr:HAD family hydrolase [Streptosporangiaceae bacterium]
MPLGLLSNGNGYPDRSGLAGVFTVVVFSDEHGISKPDRRLFDIAAEHIAISPARLAMVGDSPAHDVTGAQHAGWHGIWLNRDRRPRPRDVLPDAELHTLRDLSAALATMPCPPGGQG